MLYAHPKKSHRIRTALLIAVLGLLCSGCLLFPMSDPEKSVMDKRLLGVWEDEKGDGICFLPFDSRAYLVVAVERGEGNRWFVKPASNDGPDTSLMKGFLTKEGKDLYLNLQILVPDFVYNQTYMNEQILSQLADSAGVIDGKEEPKKSARARRVSIAKRITKETGIVPLYMLSKVELKSGRLILRNLDVDGGNMEYWTLDGTRQVREFVLSNKGTFEKPQSHRFSVPNLKAEKEEKRDE